MADTDPTAADTHDASAWDAADGGQQTDVLTGMTDNDTGTGVVDVGGNPDDVLRVVFDVDPAGLSTSDTFTVHHGMASHNYGDCAILPYSSAGGVTTTDKLSVTPGTSPMVFTLTQNFIDDLFDQGSGSFAVRLTEDGVGLGDDIPINEFQADLTSSAPVSVTPAAASAVGANLGPTVELGDLAVSAIAAAVAAVLAPLVVMGALAITPAPASAVSTTVAPTVLYGSDAATPTPTSAVGASAGPTVELGALSITPGDASAVGATVDPTVVEGDPPVSVTPAAATAVGVTVDPAVVRGPIAWMAGEADAAAAVGATVGATVVLGPIVVAPVVASVGATVDPAVELGSISVAPVAVVAIGATVDPAVVLGPISAAPATAVGATAPPVVVAGLLSITPPASSAVGLTVGPTVLGGDPPPEEKKKFSYSVQRPPPPDLVVSGQSTAGAGLVVRGARVTGGRLINPVRSPSRGGRK